MSTVQGCFYVWRMRAFARHYNELTKDARRKRLERRFNASPSRHLGSQPFQSVSGALMVTNMHIESYPYAHLTSFVTCATRSPPKRDGEWRKFTLRVRPSGRGAGNFGWINRHFAVRQVAMTGENASVHQKTVRKPSHPPEKGGSCRRTQRSEHREWLLPFVCLPRSGKLDHRERA